MKLFKLVLFLVVIGLVNNYIKSIQGPTIFYWAITLPGTFFHEVAHWIAAFLMNGNPSTFSIIPEFDKYGHMQTMGHVNFRNLTWYNGAPIGLAPLLLIPFTLACASCAISSSSILSIMMWGYFAACSWSAFMPSPADFSIAASSPASWPIAVVIFGTFCYFTFVTFKLVIKPSRK